MNFLLVSNMFPDKKNPGYGSFVKNVCDGLSKYDIVCKYKAVISGKGVSKLQKISKYLIVLFQLLKFYFRKFDFIYAHYPNQLVPLLWCLNLIKRRKYVINFHGEDLLYRRYGYRLILGKLTEKFCKKYATIIVVPSQYFKNIVIERNLIDAEYVIVSPSGGINPHYFFPSKKTSFASDVVHIGFVGRLQIDKGIMEFAELCKIINTQNRIRLTATIIGYGECSTMLKEFINRNSLSGCISVIEGVSQSQLGEYYRNMDLFVFNSFRKSESLGLTGIEAMACGIPVIGCNVGGIATYVKDGHNGWLVPVHNINSICDRIYEWVCFPSSKKRKIQQNAIETAKLYYTDNVCEKLAQDITSILI